MSNTITEMNKAQTHQEAIDALRAQVKALAQERDGYKQAADMVAFAFTQWSKCSNSFDTERTVEPMPQWVHLIARTVHTLHSYNFTKADATCILAFCIQSVVFDKLRLQWAGDEVATTAPETGQGA